MTVSRSCDKQRIGDLMETSMEPARVGLASAKARHGLTEAKLRELQPSERAYKVSDGGNGLYVVISPSGSRSFRYDYRLSGRRETLTIGRHEPVARQAQRSHLAYGMDVTLEEARLLLARTRVDVSSGRSPARAKQSRLGLRVPVVNRENHQGLACAFASVIGHDIMRLKHHAQKARSTVIPASRHR